MSDERWRRELEEMRLAREDQRRARLEYLYPGAAEREEKARVRQAQLDRDALPGRLLKALELLTAGVQRLADASDRREAVLARIAATAERCERHLALLASGGPRT